MSLTEILTAIGVLANTGWIIYSSWKKNKPEVKKLEVEADSEIVESANLNLEGAGIAQGLLLARITELTARIEDNRKDYEARMAKIEETRLKDLEYFRRRIKDLERESRDYRSWAARLVRQVVDAKLVPVQFVPSFGDSETGITAIRTDLENSDTTPK